MLIDPAVAAQRAHSCSYVTGVARHSWPAEGESVPFGRVGHLAPTALRSASGSRYNFASHPAIRRCGEPVSGVGVVGTRSRGSRGRRMAICSECEADIDVDEFDVDRGDQLSCSECGATLVVSGLSPIVLQLVDVESVGDVDEPADEDSDDDRD